MPGTVLTTLIRNGLLPDPDIGLAHSGIPDIYHAGHSHYTYWFCTSISATVGWGSKEGNHAALILHGINYSARCAGARSPHTTGTTCTSKTPSALA